MVNIKHKKKIVDYYDNFANRFQNTDLLYFDKAAQYEFGSILKVLNIPKGESKNIIELGSGHGKYVLALLKRGHWVTAVDVSQNSLDLLLKQARKNKLEKKLNILRADFTKPVYKEKYDIGLCISTYHVLSDNEKEKIKIFSNFVQAIKPGGYILLVEPNPYNPLFYFFYLFYPVVQRDNIKFFLGSSPFRLKKILRNMGLVNIQIHRVGFLPLRFMKKIPQTQFFNEFINKTPVLNIFSSFSYITAYKK